MGPAVKRDNREVVLSNFAVDKLLAAAVTPVDSLATGFDLEAYRWRRFWGLTAALHNSTHLSTGSLQL